MFLESLHLKNFRGFRDLKLPLGRQLTVLIGGNGVGKTSVVDAIRMVAAGADFRESDVTIGATEYSIEVCFSGGKRTLFGNGLRQEALMEEPDRSALMVFGADRTSPQDEGSPAWFSFEQQERWFRDREDVENQARVRAKKFDLVDRTLQRVRDAIEAVLPGFRNPVIDRERPGRPGASQFVIHKGDLPITADMLSAGERSLLVLAIAIARRLKELPNGMLGKGPCTATVVIDEIELHLHPRWQREVVPALLRAFPECQLIVTTHSPQVLGSVSRESLVILEDFAAYETTVPTEGRDSNAILEELMGASQRPEAAEAKLREVAEAIDEGAFDRARPVVDQLAERWGEDDREVVRLRTALAFREG